MFAQTNSIKSFAELFQKATEGTGRVALCYGISFVSFSLGLFMQRKAAKDLWYQDLLDAFFFEGKAPKKKALQKRNGVFCANAAQAVAFEKAT